ncbi:UDP-xylose and UDP-N-acetylglucosamine transporter [Caerostris darwini]|uniref:UDP-xylose and UDP-N-acetylglucosamine transporter n=1 Tax=Caerostris darwini TaxID=1538125 RepID=A0AAV4N205_9ARAC|nr:UDP-xylose and UDP-N-acetylglucosamine transporter [Caerostris darwini]
MALLFVVLTIISCCSNVVLLEILMKEVPGCGNIITFSQFFFIALIGFIFTSKYGTKKPAIPIRNYVILVIIYFAVSVSNNCALNFDIPMPLHMIFKSGSLVTSMMLGILILKRRYSVQKYISVILVSIGIFIATFASKKIKVEDFEIQTGDQLWIGISLLSFSLLMSAGLGIYQETLYKQFGKHPLEMLFYSHALSLPGFIILANDISSFIPLFSKSDLVQLLPMVSLPKMWLYLLGNVLTQYICARSVFTIASNYSSLTVTMIITCRKFISLIFSILYFNNSFTFAHWVGTFLVFTGTLLFTDIRSLMHQKHKIK